MEINAHPVNNLVHTRIYETLRILSMLCEPLRAIKAPTFRSIIENAFKSLLKIYEFNIEGFYKSR